MKKGLKAIASMTLALVLMLGNVSVVFAADFTEKLGQDGYDTYSINFSQTDVHALSENANHIDEAITFVQSLALDEKGFLELENAFITELEVLASEGIQLKSYAIALPRAEEYYGTYDGYTFRAAYSFYSDNYFYNLYGKADHTRWVSGLVNITMSFANWKIGFPYALFSSLVGVGNVTYYDGARTEITNEDEITSRYILIEDKDHKVSYQPNTYIPVIQDMVRISHTSIASYTGSPYGNPSMDATMPINEIASTNFYNKTNNLNSGLNHYISGNVTDTIVDTVPRAVFRFGK
ncbi:hypothetical protein SDC9_60938 [bioreactor metagenome]|uniref:Uncharacterized protein n=1 Tax=bioreactor metagenome TaxID=1076179 RepID=A0A644XKG6_9ZZZZ